MNKKRTKAFTLTELLVVVIVLGVLAAVAVPKFTRVLETRKTTEAEDIFAAVRTEQENRCVFGKKYLTDKKQLTMLAGADNSANYTYSLTNQGITAASSKGYQLKMLSYKDGQICCEGEYCGSLNKSYPSCSALSVASDECAGEVTEDHKMCSPSSKPTSSESCNGCGTRTRSVTCDTGTGSWVTGLWGECSKTAEECNPCPDGYTYDASLNECVPDGKMCSPSSKPTSSESCNGCGTRTRSVTCNTSTGSWVAGLWGECSKTAEECNPCPDGYTYNADLNECVPNEEPCPDGYSREQQDCSQMSQVCSDESVIQGVWKTTSNGCGRCELPEACPTYQLVDENIDNPRNERSTCGSLTPDGACRKNITHEQVLEACKKGKVGAYFINYYTTLGGSKPGSIVVEDPNKGVENGNLGGYGGTRSVCVKVQTSQGSVVNNLTKIPTTGGTTVKVVGGAKGSLSL